MFKKKSIEIFFGYAERHKIQIALPNSFSGSGLTLIIGEIDSGKSAIFEAVKKFYHGAKFLPKERNQGKNPVIELTDKNNDIVRIEKGNLGNVSIKSSSNLIKENIFELIPSRRHWHHTFRTHNGIFNYLSYLGIKSNTKYDTDRQLGCLLEKILQDSSLKTKFDNMIRFLYPSLSSWEIDCDNDGNNIISYKSNETQHDTSLICTS